MNNKDIESAAQKAPVLHEVRYYTEHEVRVIIEQLDEYYVFYPHLLSEKLLLVARLERGHQPDNSLLCLEFTKDMLLPKSEFSCDADTGRDLMVTHIWNLLKNFYAEMKQVTDNSQTCKLL